MKVEGATVQAIAAIQTIKVKEEAKECCEIERSSSSSTNPVPAATTTPSSTISIQPISLESTTSSAATSTTVVTATIDDRETSIIATTISPSTSSTPLSPEPGALGPPTSSSTTLQSSGVICQASTSPSSRLTMVNKSSESFPVDLDLKTKVPQVLPNGPSPSREKLSKDRGSDEDAEPQTASKENRLSPCAINKTKAHQKQAHGSIQSEYVRGGAGGGGAGCQYAGSCGTESPLSSHSIKPENEDSPVSRHSDEVQNNNNNNNSSSNNNNNNTTNNNNNSSSNNNETNGVSISNGGASSGRCISGIFAGHGKLKRLLGTLVQFATNISQDTGESVRGLVLGLLSGTLTAEEFHSALQEATNFPLRGFVLPYLRHTLPSLRRDLTAAARANSQTCVQYLRLNESTVLETVSLTPSSETVDLFGDHSNGNSVVGTNPTHPCSTNYGIMRSGSTTGVGAIQHANSNSGAAALHQHYSSTPTNLATKRRASDTSYYENGGPLDDGPIYGKRSSNPWAQHTHQQQQPQQQQQPSDPYCWYHPLHSSGGSIQSHPHAPSPVPPGLVQVNQLTSFGPPQLPHQQQQQQQQQLGHVGGSMQNSSSLDDEWKNIHVMLNCILGMVEKTKRALAILQRRGSPSPAATVPPLTSGSSAGPQNGNSNGNSSSSNGSHVESSTGDRDAGNLKRLSGEIVAQTIRATEDRVAEVKRRAEEAVQEVKRAAVAEVQRAVAVAVAESRANERLRVHRLLDLPLPHRSHGAQRQNSFIRVAAHINPTNPEAVPRTPGGTLTTSLSASAAASEDEKDVSHMTNVIGSGCWNCGRTALETCGGCGVARYCGSFCQHRDWEAGGHHATCNSSPSRERPRRSPSRSPPRSAAVVANPNDNDSSGASTATTAK